MLYYFKLHYEFYRIIDEQHCKMVFTLGLYFGFCATYQYSMVQHFKFFNDSNFLIWDGSNDYIAYIT